MRSVRTVSIAVALLITVCCAADVSAQGGVYSLHSLGPRAGVGLEPDQFVIGGQAVLGRMLYTARLEVCLDIGFGDDMTVTTFDADMYLPLPGPPKAPISFYVAAGPTLAYIDPEYGDEDIEIGFTISGGIKMPMGIGNNHYNLEGRFGFGDIPEVKILFGIMFGGM